MLVLKIHDMEKNKHHVGGGTPSTLIKEKETHWSKYRKKKQKERLHR